MEFLSAFSGLERIAIIGGAILIGYWGFRLFATDRTPGLIFMGIASAVLIAVLATGGNHVQTVSSSLQSNATTAADPDTTPSAISPNTPQATPQATPQPGPQMAAEPAPEAAAEADASGTSNARVIADVTETDAAAIPETEPPAVQTDVLAGRDLGGRIVAVKSENVTLEWTPPSATEPPADDPQ